MRKGEIFEALYGRSYYNNYKKLHKGFVMRRKRHLRRYYDDIYNAVINAYTRALGDIFNSKLEFGKILERMNNE